MIESKIEDKWRKVIEGAGGMLRKWVSPGWNGCPDRIVLKPIPPECREIVARYIQFWEFKQEGKKPRTLQAQRIKALEALGFTCKIIDSPPK